MKDTGLTSHPIPVRVSGEDRAWLNQEAARRDRSLSYLIREAIREKRKREFQTKTA